MLTKLFILTVAAMGIATTPSFGETAIEAMNTAHEDTRGEDIPPNFNFRSAPNCQADHVITRRSVYDSDIGSSSSSDRPRRSPDSCSCSSTCNCRDNCVCSGSAVCRDSCICSGNSCRGKRSVGDYGGLWAARVSDASTSSADVNGADVAPVRDICEFCFCNATNTYRYCERVDCTNAMPVAKNSWKPSTSLSPWSGIKAAVPLQVYTVDDGFCYVFPVDAHTGRKMVCFTHREKSSPTVTVTE